MPSSAEPCRRVAVADAKHDGQITILTAYTRELGLRSDLEICEAPLRNRTVDLLLAMGRRGVGQSQVRRPEQARRKLA
jgi:hypothetical protein